MVKILRKQWKVHDMSNIKRETNPRDYVVQNPDIHIGPIVDDSQNFKSNFQEHHVDDRSKAQEKKSWLKRFKTGTLLLVLLPIFAAVIPIIFILGTFIHAVDNRSLKLLNDTTIPYVSDIGNFKPHSSVFTLGVVLASIFTLGVVIVRYYQGCNYTSSSKSKKRINFAGLIGGLFSTGGLMCVGAFQLSSHHKMHFLGAFIYFFSFSFYSGIQTWITLKFTKRKSLFLCRLILFLGIFVNFVLFGIFLTPKLSKYNRTGYSLAQTFEWLSVSCIIVFILTFVFDFWSLRLKCAVEKI